MTWTRLRATGDDLGCQVGRSADWQNRAVGRLSVRATLNTSRCGRNDAHCVWQSPSDVSASRPRVRAACLCPHESPTVVRGSSLCTRREGVYLRCSYGRCSRFAADARPMRAERWPQPRRVRWRSRSGRPPCGSRGPSRRRERKAMVRKVLSPVCERQFFMNVCGALGSTGRVQAERKRSTAQPWPPGKQVRPLHFASQSHTRAARAG